ncbi:DUF1501 domain-containing protein [Musicola paradisiaca]|uniref:DUF1501 domain-containing protein n=1 Tax=Musicola paradisiaca (strain Ech703) TaxID=579405 RepID=C6C3A5_MUSP7|nr:DUF1501 domain-containing protein [Musicola paradisiaca]ACS87203.1 protein of unknown function DUF1501 [Musicola paradisiaca Ech703]
MITRRGFIQLAAAGAAMLIAPRIVFARAATDSRFIFIIQRGAADGLNIVIPYADPGYTALRGELAIDTATAIKLDGTFALHPSLSQIGNLYAQREALFIHAIASPYRDRSHFDGQNVLETGGSAPFQIRDGWLNRLVGMIHGATPTPHENAIAFAPTIPLALRGTTDIASYAPSGLPRAPEDLLMRVSQLYAEDAQLHALWESALATRGLVGNSEPRQDPASIGKMAANILSRADGPRIAMLETSGWDTHSAQTPRLASQLKALDMLIAALRDGLGPVWNNTVILVATEFGRTVATNGTDGTDHGTASAAMVIGGAVSGGRIMADWPGLRPGDLYESRDLKPTASLDALIAGLASESFHLDPGRITRTLFARSPGITPMTGLLRSS